MSGLSVISLAAGILGFCGVVYELVLAQTLSILRGQSAVQYSVTIGLFLAGMGLGSHRSEFWSRPALQLWRIQLGLSILAPTTVLAVWWLSTAAAPVSIAGSVTAYLGCLGIGALTGTELPLLMKLEKDRREVGRILRSDYAGMLIACAAFPLVLLPTHGIFVTLFATALLNSVVMGCLRPSAIRLVIGVPAVLVTALTFEPQIREWLSQRLIGG